MVRTFFTAILIALVSWPLLAAGPRRVTFSHVSTNRITYPISRSAASTCTIALTNQSEVEQEIDLVVDASASGIASGPATLISSTASPSASVQIAPGVTQKFTYEFPSIPPAVIGAQTVICRGSIVAKSAGAQGPAHLQASGSLSIFHETSKMTDKSTEAKKLMGSGMRTIFKSQSFLINGGRPF